MGANMRARRESMMRRETMTVTKRENKAPEVERGARQKQKQREKQEHPVVIGDVYGLLISR